MRRDTAVVLATLLLAVAVLASTCAEQQPATASVKSTTQHRCIHDELQRSTPLSSMPTVTVVATNDTQQRAAAQLADDWQPLRIGTFADDISIRGRYCSAAGDVVPNHDDGRATCSENDILTDEKRNILTQYMLPRSVSMHEHYLRVERLNGRILVVPFLDNNRCSTFAIPSSHFSSGVGGVDFIVYIAATPTRAGIVAWAVACARVKVGERPLVGAANIGPAYIDRDPEASRVVTHELLHALGFSYGLFAERKLVNLNSNIRGKPGLLPTFTGDNAVREARKQYNCPTLSSMELEDEGGDGTAGSHWKRRNARDELMAGSLSGGFYTAITLGAMEDLGYYKANYADAETMTWGRDAGCDFLEKKCMTNNITQWPSMFCNDTNTPLGCTTARTNIAGCAIGAARAAVPAYFQYFTDASLIGSPFIIDYCPIREEYRGFSCLRGSPLTGQVIGQSSGCLDAQNLPQLLSAPIAGVCAELRCDPASSTYRARFDGTTNFVNCPQGSTIDLSAIGATLAPGIVTCAPYNEVCQILVTHTDAAMMQRAGICLALLVALLLAALL